MAQHPGRLVHEEPLERFRARRSLRPDQPLVVEQARIRDGLEVAQPVSRQRAVHLAVGIEDPALGVAKAPRLEACVSAGVGGRPHGRETIGGANGAHPAEPGASATAPNSRASRIAARAAGRR